jgi:VTC domain
MSPSIDIAKNPGDATEIKFLVHRALAERILDWARLQLPPDPHTGGDRDDGYRMTTLYFDTDKFDVFHRRGSFGRSIYRIRRYEWGRFAFLERRIKTRSHLSKRRCVVDLRDLDRLNHDLVEADWAGGWFHRRLQTRRLRPVCEISCHRTARAAMTEQGPIRLTLDRGLRAERADGLRFSERQGTLMLENWTILELKFRREMPALFERLVEEFGLSPQRISKYRLAMSSLGLASDAAHQSPPDAIADQA